MILKVHKEYDEEIVLSDEDAEKVREFAKNTGASLEVSAQELRQNGEINATEGTMTSGWEDYVFEVDDDQEEESDYWQEWTGYDDEEDEEKEDCLGKYCDDCPNILCNFNENNY